MMELQKLAAEYGVRLVEDCAQALGAADRGQPVGSIGDLGCLSFFPSKNLGCFGDGGMVLTNDERLFERVEYLRRHGGRVKYHHEELGLNSRLDELQAAILRVKLPHLAHWNSLRRAKAHHYNRLLAGCQAIQLPPEPQFGDGLPYSVYHQYTIRLSERERVAQQLARDGIATCVYYPVPLHLQPVHAGLGYRTGAFPHAESAARRCLSLPMFPELTDEQQRTVVSRLVAAVECPALA
jgi:dTDP-4-amino-4,6-dideoxygalactose transaminase